jgi:hypothetical protein
MDVRKNHGEANGRDYIFSMAVQPHSGLGHLIFEVPRSHTNAHSVGLL